MCPATDLNAKHSHPPVPVPSFVSLSRTPVMSRNVRNIALIAGADSVPTHCGVPARLPHITGMKSKTKP